MKIITGKTLIPLSFAVLTIGGAAFWLSSLQAMAVATKETMHHVISKQDHYNECIMHIRSDIAEIKGELKRIEK